MENNEALERDRDVQTWTSKLRIKDNAQLHQLYAKELEA